MNKFETAVILAGGKSSRMGFDKQLLKINDELIYQGVSKSLKAMFSDIAVVTNTPNLYENSSIRVLKDEYKDMGPLAGIHVALKHSQSEYVYLLACDMPVISPSYVSYMKRRIEETGADICVSERNGKIEPFNAFYSTSLLSDLEKRLEDKNSSLFKFISSANTLVISQSDAENYDNALEMFTNLNTKGEYDGFLKKVSSR